MDCAERAADLEIMRQKKMAKVFALYVEQANKRKDYATIVAVGDHIQESLLLEDEFLLQYYDRVVKKQIR